MSKKETEEKKEDKQDSKTEEELEKEIEETESQEEEKVLEKTIDDNEFQEFIKLSNESLSPVLEPVKTLSPELLEQNVGSAPIIQEEKEEKSKDYSKSSNEPNYSSSDKIKYQANTGPPILKPTEISEDLPRQGLLEPIIKMENNLRPKMVDVEFIEQKTRFPFEKDDKKYKEFR